MYLYTFIKRSMFIVHFVRFAENADSPYKALRYTSVDATINHWEQIKFNTVKQLILHYLSTILCNTQKIVFLLNNCRMRRVCFLSPSMRNIFYQVQENCRRDHFNCRVYAACLCLSIPCVLTISYAKVNSVYFSLALVL